MKDEIDEGGLGMAEVGDETESMVNQALNKVIQSAINNYNTIK
jgi:hypothetical protein